MSVNSQSKRVEMYDTTLRDGTQGEGVALSLVDKLEITKVLDALGVDYIEGGYPLSNPKDVAYFQDVRKLSLKHAKVCAFGMTRRKGILAKDDPGMQALVGALSPVVTIVGKTSALHVDEVLQISREENLAMITDSVAFVNAAAHKPEVFYDAEHFFDGYKLNPEYAFETILAAVKGGARRVILCDTNGGSLPGFVTRIVLELTEKLSKALAGMPNQFAGLGIHCHNDSGLAVANSLAAVEAGAVQVQGTINGIGERCGNVDLTTVAANLALKMGYEVLQPGSVAKLTNVSRYVYERANLNLSSNQPYVGGSAFAHKGGMHVHAVQKLASSYEHINPELVGNSRKILVSELSGVSNINSTLGAKFKIEDKGLQRKVLERVQDLEHQGYQFEAANASLELLFHDVLGTRPRYWDLDNYRVTISKRNGAAPGTEATVKLHVQGKAQHQVSEGDGPVNALDGALRKCLVGAYPQINRLHLRDFKVRVVNPTAESAAKVRVVVDFAVVGEEAGSGADQPITRYFSTIGVNENVVEASWQALTDAIAYHLIELGVK
jgi:2-isopropylmalate synthase